MKTIVTLLLSLWLVAQALPAGAQCDKHAPEPPVIKDVVAASAISFDKQTGIYTYQYTLKNGEESTGCLRSFEIDITKAQGTVALPSKGLSDYPRYIYKQPLDDPDVASMIPVSFPDLPRINYQGRGVITSWNAGTSGDGFASWSAAVKNYIAPGEEVAGFILTTFGPPGIRVFKAKPNYIAEDEDLIAIGATEDDIIEHGYEWLSKFYESIAFKGKTIGPTAPPEELVPADFLQGIMDMKHEALELGWVTNEGIKDSLDMKLEAALKKFQSGNTKAAKNILGAFINEVEAQGCESYDDCPKGKHLSPEAYALLKFNAQYLIDNLK